jgi:hypothetical protein
MDKIYHNILELVRDRNDTVGCTFLNLLESGFIGNPLSDYGKLIAAFEIAHYNLYGDKRESYLGTDLVC